MQTIPNVSGAYSEAAEAIAGRIQAELDMSDELRGTERRLRADARELRAKAEDLDAKARGLREERDHMSHTIEQLRDALHVLTGSRSWAPSEG